MDTGIHLNPCQPNRLTRTYAMTAAFGAVAAGDSDKSLYGFGQPGSKRLSWNDSSEEDTEDEFKGMIIDNFDYRCSLYT
jgi:hypothetical protein